MANEVQVAREYRRVSKDDAKSGRSPREQGEANARAAKDEGWLLGDPYEEPDARSASRYAQRARTGFLKLVADLKDELFGADILIMWEASRGSRDARDWLELLELLSTRNVHLYITSDERLYNLSKHRDWKTLADEATAAEYRSRQSSAELIRAMAANADEGRPHAPCAFGYERLYDPKTGQPGQPDPNNSERTIFQHPHPDHAPLVVDAFERVARGESIKSIMRIWEKKGLRNRNGNPYDPSFFRRMLLNEQYIAIRVHEVGRRGNAPLTDKAVRTPGGWDPLVSRDVFDRVGSILRRPERETNPLREQRARATGEVEARARWFLSLIARCDVCEGPLQGKVIHPTSTHPKLTYACRRGHLAVSMAEVDEIVEELIVRYLEREDAAEAAATLEQDTEALRVVRAEIGSLRQRLEEVAEQAVRGELSLPMVARIEKGVDEQLQAALAEERHLSTPDALTTLFETGAGARERWTAMKERGEETLARRRQVARAVLVPRRLGEARIMRATKYRQPAVERLRFAR